MRVFAENNSANSQQVTRQNELKRRHATEI
uniref:Uncharacterized protein n=1 Tax=Heterorhabditis bacteriophora TaxID=37862 RepID=A0A1I7WIQ0_HETBA